MHDILVSKFDTLTASMSLLRLLHTSHFSSLFLPFPSSPSHSLCLSLFYSSLHLTPHSHPSLPFFFSLPSPFLLLFPPPFFSLYRTVPTPDVPKKYWYTYNPCQAAECKNSSDAGMVCISYFSILCVLRMRML